MRPVQPDPVEYHAFLLRLWRENGARGWRATLRDIRDGEQVNFVSLETLATFLTELQANDGAISAETVATVELSDGKEFS